MARRHLNAGRSESSGGSYVDPPLAAFTIGQNLLDEPCASRSFPGPVLRRVPASLPAVRGGIAAHGHPVRRGIRPRDPGQPSRRSPGRQADPGIRPAAGEGPDRHHALRREQLHLDPGSGTQDRLSPGCQPRRQVGRRPRSEAGRDLPPARPDRPDQGLGLLALRLAQARCRERVASEGVLREALRAVGVGARRGHLHRRREPGSAVGFHAAHHRGHRHLGPDPLRLPCPFKAHGASFEGTGGRHPQQRPVEENRDPEPRRDRGHGRSLQRVQRRSQVGCRRRPRICRPGSLGQHRAGCQRRGDDPYDRRGGASWRGPQAARGTASRQPSANS